MKNITKVTMIYRNKTIIRYFYDMNKFNYLYPDVKIISNEYITDRKEINKIAKNNFVFE